MQQNRKICPYFLQGTCRFGNKCKDLHVLPTNNNNNQRQGQFQHQQQQHHQHQQHQQHQHQQHQQHPADRKVCKYYLQGTCKFGDRCKDYHPSAVNSNNNNNNFQSNKYQSSWNSTSNNNNNKGSKIRD